MPLLNKQTKSHPQIHKCGYATPEMYLTQLKNDWLTLDIENNRCRIALSLCRSLSDELTLENTCMF